MSKITANTLLQGLFVANYLLEVSANKNLQSIELATFHNFAGRTLSGSMLMKKENRMLILSTFYPMQMLNSLFYNPDYVLNKKILTDECFIYNFSDKKTKKQLIYFVNWSDKAVSHTIKGGMQSDCIKKEYFGNSLYSTTLDERNKILINRQKLESLSEIQLKPYSFTMLSIDE